MSRPPFIHPDTDSVCCFICGRYFDPDRARGIDLSGPEDFYPKMKPVCSNCSDE